MKILRGVSLLKSDTCINTGYTNISTNDRLNINAHRYKARYGLPFYTMIMMVATIGGPIITMRPNPIHKIFYYNIHKTNNCIKPFMNQLILLHRDHVISTCP
jgi:hypothetical protein